MTDNLYGSKQWQVTRQRILRRDLYSCQMCGCGLVAGRTHPRAAVVHHRIPHHGDPVLFWCPDDDLEAACAKCHNGALQREETRGYSNQIGVDGFPVDKRHPFWTGPHWLPGNGRPPGRPNGAGS